jgi:hypothetical protein
MGLAPALLRALSTLGHDTPTPIQQQAIPLVLDGHDLMGAAQTGTGKTGAFAEGGQTVCKQRQTVCKSLDTTSNTGHFGNLA